MSRRRIHGTFVTRCQGCGEELEISGTFDMTDDGFAFTSDEGGTKTAWDHQAQHDQEAS